MTTGFEVIVTPLNGIMPDVYIFNGEPNPDNILVYSTHLRSRDAPTDVADDALDCPVDMDHWADSLCVPSIGNSVPDRNPSPTSYSLSLLLDSKQ